MNRLDYVVSGTSYMRLSNPKIATNDTNVEIVNILRPNYETMRSSG